MGSLYWVLIYHELTSQRKDKNMYKKISENIDFMRSLFVLVDINYADHIKIGGSQFLFWTKIMILHNLEMSTKHPHLLHL